MKFLLDWIFVVLALLGLILTGCQSSGLPAPKAFPQEMGKSWEAIGTSILSQTIWDKMDGNIRGHVIEPGVEGYFIQKYAIGSRLVGVDGDVNLMGEGTGSGQMNEAFIGKLIDRFGTEQATVILEFLATEKGPTVTGFETYPPGETKVIPPEEVPSTE